MCIVMIGNQNNDHLEIEILGRMHPDCKDYYDGNWLSCKIYVKAGFFVGKLDGGVCLRTDEFESFFDNIKFLHESLKGKAEYSSMEDWLKFEVSGDGLGHMLVKGHIIDNYCGGNRLNFTINFDQTSLPETINGLKSLLDKYPVIGR